MSSISKQKIQDLEERLVFLNEELSRVQGVIDEQTSLLTALDSQFPVKEQVMSSLDRKIEDKKEYLTKLGNSAFELDHLKYDSQKNLDSINHKIKEAELAYSEEVEKDMKRKKENALLTDQFNQQFLKATNSTEESKQFLKELKLKQDKLVEFSSELGGKARDLEQTCQNLDLRETKMVTDEGQLQERGKRIEQEKKLLEQQKELLDTREKNLASQQKELNEMSIALLASNVETIERKFTDREESLQEMQTTLESKQNDLLKREQEYLLKEEELKLKERLLKMREKAVGLDNLATPNL